MAYISKSDLESHLYAPILEEITRGHDALVERAISAGIAEAKSYLSRYDTSQLMGDTPDPEDENLKMKTQDLVCWHLVKLANPSIDLAMMRTSQEDAIRWFDKIMSGKLSPEGWPYRDTTLDATPPDGDEIYSNSNIKRDNHW